MDSSLGNPSTSNFNFNFIANKIIYIDPRCLQVAKASQGIFFF